MKSFEQKLAETLRSHEVNPPQGLEQSVFESLDAQAAGGRHGRNRRGWVLGAVLIFGMAAGVYTGSMNAPESAVHEDPEPREMDPVSAGESPEAIEAVVFVDEKGLPMETTEKVPEGNSVKSKVRNEARNLEGLASPESQSLRPNEPKISELHPHSVMEVEEDEIKSAELQQPSGDVWRMDARIIIKD